VTRYIPRSFTRTQTVTHPRTNPAVHGRESNSQSVDHESDALSRLNVPRLRRKLARPFDYCGCAIRGVKVTASGVVRGQTTRPSGTPLTRLIVVSSTYSSVLMASSGCVSTTTSSTFTRPASARWHQTSTEMDWMTDLVSRVVSQLGLVSWLVSYL